MNVVNALLAGSPFGQWHDIGVSDVPYLAPWILLIWLLVPKSGESKSLRIPWRTVLLTGAIFVILAFLALVVYYLLEPT